MAVSDPGSSATTIPILLASGKSHPHRPRVKVAQVPVFLAALRIPRRMHATTGNWRRGFALSLVTAFCWGVLPIALKHLLVDMDAITVTWYRLATAALALAIYLAWQRKVPRL